MRIGPGFAQGRARDRRTPPTTGRAARRERASRARNRDAARSGAGHDARPAGRDGDAAGGARARRSNRRRRSPRFARATRVAWRRGSNACARAGDRGSMARAAAAARRRARRADAARAAGGDRLAASASTSPATSTPRAAWARRRAARFARSTRAGCPGRAQQRDRPAADGRHVVHARSSTDNPQPVQSDSPQRRQHGVVRGRARPRLLRGSLHDRLLVLGARGSSATTGCRPSSTSTKYGWPPSTAAAASAGTRPCPSSTCRWACPTRRPSDYGRAHFGLPDRPFIFLYTFDVSSQMERKNPMGAVRAFRQAGLAHDDAMLLLKFTNAHTNRDAVDRLVRATDGLNVHVIDGALDRDDVCGADARHRLLPLAAPRRGLRPDHRRTDGAGQAGHRDGVLRQPRLHDARRELPGAGPSACRSIATTVRTCAA